MPRAGRRSCEDNAMLDSSRSPAVPSPAVPSPAVTRRGFIATSVGTGFTLAVTPVSAAAILTDTVGLKAGEVPVSTADGDIPAYRAMPASGGPFPVVLVVQEIFGVHEYIQDICRRLAKQGYLAIAPELYARQGDPAAMDDMQRIIREIVSEVPDEQVMSDLDATVAWAADSGDGDTGRLAITGFCWGGRIVWLYAAHNPALKAGVAWYGRLVGEAGNPMTPRHPIQVAASLHAPVLGLYGGRDSGIPMDTVERMRAALPEGNGSEIIVYPDSQHGFHADYRPSYDPEAAWDGWARMHEWFGRHGAG